MAAKRRDASSGGRDRAQEAVPGSHGTTPAENRRGESLADRLRQEEPDVLDIPAADIPRPGTHPGRLVAPDLGSAEDTEPQSIATDYGRDAGDFSAEEQAIHVERDESR